MAEADRSADSESVINVGTDPASGDEEDRDNDIIQDDSSVTFSMAPLAPASAAALARLRAYVCPPTVYTSMPLTRRAAVLLLLFADRNGNLRVLLTVRSNKMSSYSGQVALPGGKADSLSETAFETARREAEEEVGLPRQNLPAPFRVEHLCELPAQLSATEQAVRPCVAFLHTDASTSTSSKSTGDSIPKRRGDGTILAESLIPRLNATEVSAIFSAPFRRFISSTVEGESEGESRVSSIRYEGHWQTWNGTKWRMHNFFIPKKSIDETARRETSHNDSTVTKATATATATTKAPYSSHEAKDAPKENSYKVWGLTARILIDSARVAYGEDPEFEFLPEIGEENMIQRLRRRGKLVDERVSGAVLPRRPPEWSGSDSGSDGKDGEGGKSRSPARGGGVKL